MKNLKSTRLLSAVLTFTLSISIAAATDIAANLKIYGSGSAGLFFDRTDQGSDSEWEIWGDNSHLSIRDDVNDTNYYSKLVFELQHSLNNENSFIVDTSGDINLADGSVFIDKSENRIGIGTSMPYASLHIKDSVPSITLEATGNSQWTFQAGYRLVGPKGSTVQVDNLTIFDHSSNTRPFEIQENAPNESFVIKEDGNIGLGTGIPVAKLDVRGNTVINGELNTTKAITASFSGSVSDSAYKMMDISVNNSDTSKKSDVGFAMTNTREGFTWSLRTWEPNSGFAISKYGNGGTKEFRLHDADPTDATTVVLTLANGAYCDGVWHNTSSRSMKQDIQPLSTKEALEAFKKLQPVTYVYKSNPTDPKVGFIAEDVPELVADPKHKSLSAMDMVALLTKVVQAKEVEIEALKKKNSEIENRQRVQDEKIAKLEALQNKVVMMERILTNLALDTSCKKENLSLSQ